MYQQSVTLTARMSYRNANEGGEGESWLWAVGGDGDYLPLLVAICSAIVVIVLVLSAVFLWRCCLLTRRKHHYCDGVFCEVPPQPLDSSKSPRDTAVYALRNGPWAFHSRVLTSSTDSLYAVPRSRTLTALSTRSCDVHGRQTTVAADGRLISKQLTMIIPAVSSSESSTYVREISPSSSLHALDGLHYVDSLAQQHRAKSTPTLEDDLYAQVNFSKKRRNRMGKDDAAVIALSKSRSQLDTENNDHPHVVYNERTAL